MAIEISCTYCGRIHSLPDEMAGQVVPCEGCQLTMLVPELVRRRATRAEKTAEPPRSPRPVEPVMMQEASPPLRRRTREADEPYLAAEAGDKQLETCLNHRGLPSTAECQRCREAFCAMCLVTFQHQRLCGKCKDRAAAKLRTSQKGSALCYVSLVVALPATLFVCLGILCGPIAIALGVLGLRKVEADPQLSGRAWAWSGIVLGAYSFLFSITFALRFYLFEQRFD